MDGRLEITEDEIWREIDKYFGVNHREEGEYDLKYFTQRYGVKRSAAMARLKAMENDGVATSRLVVDNGTVIRVWKFIK